NRFILLVFVILVMAAGREFAQTPTLAVDAQRALVGQYCAGCHNDNVKSGGFSWNAVDLQHPEQTAERVEKVIRKLRAGLMPPPGRPRPDAATVKRFAASLESKIDAVAAAKPYAGRPALHRLNRSEYAASV